VRQRPQHDTTLTIEHVKAGIIPRDPTTEQPLRALAETHSGTLIVTPFDLVFRYTSWLRIHELEVLGDDIVGLIVTMRPILFGRPRVTIPTSDWRLEFRTRRWQDAIRVRDVLTKPVRS
jgi:hypothetical protein